MGREIGKDNFPFLREDSAGGKVFCNRSRTSFSTKQGQKDTKMKN